MEHDLPGLLTSFSTRFIHASKNASVARLAERSSRMRLVISCELQAKAFASNGTSFLICLTDSTISESSPACEAVVEVAGVDARCER